MKKRRRIQYADHLRLRLTLRQVPEQLPRRVYQRAKEQFFDTVTHHRVAAKNESDQCPQVGAL
jgi:hypothetical protein